MNKGEEFSRTGLLSRLGMVALMLGFSLELHAQSKLTLPQDHENKQGAVAFYSFLSNPVTYQTGYASGLFAGAEAEQLEITGIAFRLDPLTPSLDVLIPRLEIWASTYPKPLSEMVDNPGRNWGEDRRLVFSAENVRFEGQQNGDLQNFPVEIAFQESFFYDPGAGHLLLDYSSSGEYLGPRGYTDAASYPHTESVRTVYFDSQLFSNGEIVQISYIPVPEPSPILLMLVGCAGAILIKRRH